MFRKSWSLCATSSQCEALLSFNSEAGLGLGSYLFSGASSRGAEFATHCFKDSVTKDGDYLVPSAALHHFVLFISIDLAEPYVQPVARGTISFGSMV